MPTLRRQHLERYVRDRFGPAAKLLAFGRIGQETSGSVLKGYGYGAPIRLTFQIGNTVRRAVLETMRPGPFGHEHLADRAQAMLWDFDSYGRLPRHVRALDVGAFNQRGSLFSVAPAREFFVLTDGWTAPVTISILNTWLSPGAYRSATGSGRPRWPITSCRSIV